MIGGETMRLEWIEDILAVAETGSFQRAAERRRLTQPAFSRRLRRIEESLGAPLFDRAAKPARLLPHALAEAERMRELAAGLRALSDSLRAGARGARRRLVIASQHAIITARAPALVERLAPFDLDVRLRSANRDECLALLLTREADLAVIYAAETGAPLPSRDFLDLAEIGTEALIPVFAADGLARIGTGLTEGELPIVAYPPDVFLGAVQRALIVPALPPALRPRPRIETALTPAALHCALAGVGVAWVPASLAAAELARGALADLGDRLPAATLRVLLARVGGRADPETEAIWRALAAPG